MKDILVKEMMLSLQEYATIDQEATLYQAITSLEKAQLEYLKSRDSNAFPHRAILVLNSDQKVVGKLSQLDILKGLEPKYNDLIDSESMARTATSGFSSEFLKTMVSQYHLFDKPLQDLCRKSASIKVKEIMYAPGNGEYVHKEDTLEIAVHQLIVGHHQSLLVINDQDIVGILRLVDVFQEVTRQIKTCSFE